MLMIAMMTLAACNQESHEKIMPAAEKVEVIKKEQVKIEKAVAQMHVAQAGVDNVMEKGVEKETTADTNIVSTPSKVATVEQEAVKLKPVDKAEDTKPVSTTAAPKVPEAVLPPSPKSKKVVAPLVQGKSPIKSEPNPAPSDILFKSEPTMDIAKANALTKKCKSCHATNKDKVGPSWKKIQAAYGSMDALATVFESGFAVENRKVIASDAKWKKKAKVMSGQYKNLIKKQVAKGKFTYKTLAAAIFAK